MGQKGELALENFESGCNCCQAVLLAFAPECGLDRETALRLASSFGGGAGQPNRPVPPNFFAPQSAATRKKQLTTERNRLMAMEKPKSGTEPKVTR